MIRDHVSELRNRSDLNLLLSLLCLFFIVVVVLIARFQVLFE